MGTTRVHGPADQWPVHRPAARRMDATNRALVIPAPCAGTTEEERAGRATGQGRQAHARIQHAQRSMPARAASPRLPRGGTAVPVAILARPRVLLAAGDRVAGVPCA